MSIPADLKYTESHEWVRTEADGTLTVGITDHAQEALGDIVFFEVQQLGKTVAAGDTVAVIESVKAASDIYAPVSGEIIAMNQEVADTPDSVNSAPYENWLFKVKPTAGAAQDRLMDSAAYGKAIGEELSTTGAAGRSTRTLPTPYTPRQQEFSMKLEHPDRLMNRTPLSLAALEVHDAFAERHIGPDGADQQAMLDALGFASRAALIDAVIPKAIRRADALPLGPFAEPKSEAEALAALRELADKNQVFRSYIGQGYYNAHTPAVILRNVMENPAWYTAYTPYQPEISQGRLEALLNYQQMIVDLTGLAISNASLLDEATAAAEAMTLLQRVGKSQSNVFYVAHDVLPQTIEVVRTRAMPVGIEVKVGPAADAAKANAFGVLLQYPGANGDVCDYRALADAVHAAGGHVIAAADLLALTVLTPPAGWGADVAVGNSQRFGVPVGFGGPHAAYLAVRDEFKRQMPGRLVGVTVDAQGNPALRLALQTREQHIRREKATSNVCTAQALLAIMASMYAVYHGPRGLKTIALRVNRMAALLAAGAKHLGYTLVNETFFDTLTFETGARTQALHDAATGKRINLRHVSDTRVGLSLDETTTRADLTDLLAAFAQAAFADTVSTVDELDAQLGASNTFPASLERTSAYLEHHVFNRHHSETEMLRYLRSLSDQDLALDP